MVKGARRRKTERSEKKGSVNNDTPTPPDK